MIRPDGECVAFMPDEEEVSIRQLRDAVAGTPELVCFTSDGYALFRNKEAEIKQLPLNRAATDLWHDAAPGVGENVLGRAFVAHPEHIPAFWKSVHANIYRLNALRRLLDKNCAQYV